MYHRDNWEEDGRTRKREGRQVLHYTQALSHGVVEDRVRSWEEEEYHTYLVGRG